MPGFVQGDLDAINEAIASGATKVKYGDKEVDYQSIGGLRMAKALIEAELNPRPRKTRTHGVYFKNDRYGCE